MHNTMRPFELLEPETLEEALKNLTSHGEKAKLLAGGLDLLPKMIRWQINPECLVSIQKIQGLDYIESNGDGGLKIGPLTTLRSIELSRKIRKDWLFFWEAAHQVASVQVKTMGTVVGNLCAATPASDIAPVLYALGADLKIAGPDSVKTVPIEEFYLDVGKSILVPNQVVVEISVPAMSSGSGGAFLKLQKTRASIAKVNVAVMLKVRHGIFEEIRIALGAVAPTVVRATRAEEILRSEKATDTIVEKAAEVAREGLKPITDLRSTAEYRKEMVSVLVKRAIEKALERAKTTM